MKTYNYQKYKAWPPVALDNRTWPNKIIKKSPRWCSVDLRDSNQALPIPMNLKQKLEMFDLLVRIGFKEIEIGFPSASEIEFEFVRYLIENDLIPDDVIIQVLTQARDHLIKRTCESLVGAKRAVIHVYNSTSELQRRVVFKKSRDEVKEIAISGTKWAKQYSDEYLIDTEIFYEYTPESFMGTELDYSIEVCEAVTESWGFDSKNKIIINLPSTVEIVTPNVWADQVEWFCRHFKYRSQTIISLHCHNDRGTAVAATELGVMAGADRVEGTLFGNGERTGNVDLVTLALNLYTQGIDPELNFSELNQAKIIYERCMGLRIPERQPYSGELVFTAFSGSHQDAIKKGLEIYRKSNDENSFWEVPYLPMNPADVGREYEPIIRINSQSGKGGVAFIMETEFGFKMPKTMHPEFSRVIQKISEKMAGEVSSQIINEAFENEYINLSDPFEFVSFELNASNGEGVEVSQSIIHVKIKDRGQFYQLNGEGNGPVDAFMNAWCKYGLQFTLNIYEEHALEDGAAARAVTYIQITDSQDKQYFGVGVDHNIVGASLKAITSAVNRSFRHN
ncbi:2-isopropylmalate synthase [Patescibacteria group bacterium]|nr:2-isopropylmalate synthase [Patescibacteria group bacterium]